MSVYDDEERPPAPRRETGAWRAYHSGMSSLGRGLIVLAVLQLGIGAVVLAGRADEVLLAILAVLGGVHLLAGILLLRRQHWVNHFVAVWGSLLVCANLVVIGRQGQGGGPANPGQFLGLLIAGALVYYAVQNMKLYNRAAEADRRGGYDYEN